MGETPYYTKLSVCTEFKTKYVADRAIIVQQANYLCPVPRSVGYHQRTSCIALSKLKPYMDCTVQFNGQACGGES